MASTGKSAYGTTLTRNGNIVAEITELGGVSLTAGSIELTHLTSANGYKEFIQGFRDSGEFTMKGNLIVGDTDGQVGLLTDFNAGTAYSYVMTFPTTITATWTFTGFPIAFATDPIAVDGKLGFSATIKITGKSTLAITASVNVTALAVTTATLTPVFAAATYAYVANATTTTTCTMTATFAAGVATLTSGTAVQTLTSTIASASIALAVGLNVVTISVQETGKTATVYTIWVFRTA
jgi:hypothetical protein